MSGNSPSVVRARRSTALATVVAAMLAGHAAPSLALDWQFDNGAAIYWNTTLSAGASWRAQGPDRDLYQLQAGYLLGKRDGRAGSPTDSNTLNYGVGDRVSTPFKLISDLEFKKDSFGALVRIKAWYDESLEDENVLYGHQNNDYNGARGGLDSAFPLGSFNPCPGASEIVGGRPVCFPGTWPKAKLSDKGFDDLQKFSNVYLLDAYVYGSLPVGNSDLQLRLGRQVINWGESVFIQGINQVSPIDVASARRPGTEIKELLLPVWMAYMNWGFSFGSLEAFYQFKWEPTVVDSCGSYWSPSEGLISTKVAGCGSATTFGAQANPVAGAQGFYFQQETGKEASDSGQFGVALRFPVSALDTEFGIYFQNIHSRLPIISALMGTHPAAAVTAPGLPFPIYNPAAQGGQGGWFSGLGADNLPQYSIITPASFHRTLAAAGGTNLEVARAFWEYPEDIKMYGLSAASNLFGWSVSAEASYQEDVPVQRNGNDLLQASLVGLGPLGAEGRSNSQKGADTYFRGYDLFNKTQFQVNTVKTYSNLLGAQNMLLIGEVGFQWNDVPDYKKDNTRYGRSFIYGPGGNPALAGQTGLDSLAQQNCTAPVASLVNPQPDGCKNDGYVTDFSWGYRLRASLDYVNVGNSGITVTPSVFWSHDVSGVSMDPQFIEDRQTLGLGLKLLYNKRYTLDFNYNWFADSAYNALFDRDFYGVSASVTF
jgi:hypothetical protein